MGITEFRFRNEHGVDIEVENKNKVEIVPLIEI